MSTESNKALVRRLHECFDKADWEGMRRCLAPGLKAYATGQAEAMDLAGFEALGRVFQAAFSQTRHVYEDQVAEGDRVATRARWSGIHSGEFNGIRPTNRPVQFDIFMFDRVSDGRIVEHRAAFDIMSLLAQLGALPAPAKA